MDHDGRPAYQRLAEDLRRAISDGRYAPGDALPSHADLTGKTGLSTGTIRRALALLENEGLVVSQQGVGVIVRADTPARTLEERIAALENGRDTDRELLGTLQAQLVELYGRLGQPLPGADTAPSTDRRRSTG